MLISNQLKSSARRSRLSSSPTILRQPSPTLSKMFALSAFKQNQPKTLQFQKTLPRLPVPALSSSLERYIKSLRPILLEKALKEGKGPESVDAELKKREEWAADFTKQGGLGWLLQERLKGASS